MSSDLIVGEAACGEVSNLVFHDERGFLATVQKGSELGRYYFWFLSDWLREKLSTPFVWVGQYLRDTYYFPLTHPDEGYKHNMKHAARVRELLTGDQPIPNSSAFPQMDEIRRAFTIEKVPIEIQTENQSVIFNLYDIKSIQQVNGKGIRLFLFSLYDNQVQKDGEKAEWKPATIHELGVAPILVLKALNEHGIRIDSLDLFSLGAMAFEGLRHLNDEELDIVPKTMILDRAMSSSYKVAQKQFSFLWAPMMYGAASSCNWAGDPEGACLDFFERFSNGLDGRTVIQIQARTDCYFSGVGAYDKEFLSRLEKLGMHTQSGMFYAPCFKETSHHALSRSLLFPCASHKEEEKKEEFAALFDMESTEALSDALMREVYLNPERSHGSYHQSLVVGGNAENLDILLLRAYATLQSFLTAASA